MKGRMEERRNEEMDGFMDSRIETQRQGWRDCWGKKEED